MGTNLIRVVLACVVATWVPASVAGTCGKAETDITVVYMSANDCTFCTYWEGSLSGMKSAFVKSPEFSKLNFLEVKRPRIDTPPSKTDYPEELAWLRDKNEKQPQQVFLGTPSWTVYVDGNRVERYWGTETWNDKILPGIKKIVNAWCPA